MFDMDDGCDSIVLSGTGTSAAVHCVWSGRYDASWVVCCERRCVGMGENTGKECEKKQGGGRSENTRATTWARWPATLAKMATGDETKHMISLGPTPRWQAESWLNLVSLTLSGLRLPASSLIPGIVSFCGGCQRC